MFIKFIVFKLIIIFSIQTHASVYQASELLSTLQSNGIYDFDNLTNTENANKSPAKTKLRTTQDLINATEKNKCLTHETSPDGSFSGITLSEEYLRMLEEISEQLKCQININLCKPFFSENINAHTIVASDLAETVAIDIVNIRNQPKKDNLNDSQVKTLDDVDIAIQDLKNKITSLEKKEITAERIEEIFESSTAFLWGKTLTVSGFANLKVKMTAMATAEARNNLRGGIDSFADKLITQFKNDEATKELIENIAESEKLEAKRFTKLSRVQRVKSTFANKHVKSLISKAGLTTNLVAAVGISLAIEGYAYALDSFKGENERNVAEFFEKCSGGKFIYTRAEFLAGWVPGDQFKYYDKYKINHKNKADDTGSCDVYGHANISKLENFANFDIDLIKDLISDPSVCNYLEKLTAEVSPNPKDAPQVSCPSPAQNTKNNSKRRLQLSFNSPSIDRFATTFGSPINIEYDNSKGNYIPRKIINENGFTPKHYKSEKFSFSELNLGHGLDPAYRSIADDKQVFFNDKSRSSQIYYKCKDGQQLYPGRNNPTRSKQCKYAANKSKAHRLNYHHFTNEKSYDDFFEGIDSSKSYNKLKTSEKQFSDYSKTTMVRSRQLNRTIIEAGYCCNLLEKDEFINLSSKAKSDHTEYNICKNKYRIAVGVEKNDTNSEKKSAN